MDKMQEKLMLRNIHKQGSTLEQLLAVLQDITDIQQESPLYAHRQDLADKVWHKLNNDTYKADVGLIKKITALYLAM